jgi:hypothetical protein
MKRHLRKIDSAAAIDVKVHNDVATKTNLATQNCLNVTKASLCVIAAPFRKQASTTAAKLTFAHTTPRQLALTTFFSSVKLT